MISNGFVKGHAQNKYNNIADEIAQGAIKINDQANSK